ncbi:DUF3450 family protein [Bowmanella denitrificans]|uniref:DUF3450 family protein n=1 Tax=Bowmanella denitrificans TaxID=366582 RepID=UPI000C9B17E8|nr:DUF3450 family protein [Bowmanella denitrificans]
MSALALPAWADKAQSRDKLVQQWLSLEQQKAALQSDWQQQKPVLAQRMTLLEAEKQQLQALLANSQQGSSQVQVKRAELLAQQSELEQQQVNARLQVKQLNAQLDGLASRLPPPLQTAWAQEQEGLSDDADTSALLQVALAKLDKLYAFDSRVSLYEMPVTTPTGQQVLVKQLYLGITTAWFVSPDGAISGQGRSEDDGWQWHFGDQGQAILRAVEVFEKKRQAELVPMPVQLSTGAGR